MADKKRNKKRKDDYLPPGEEVPIKPHKNEYSVAKWLRKNVPIKRTKFLNHNVEYFTGKRAVDALLESSKFTKGDGALFTTREEIVKFLHEMLEHKFYHRARKVPVSEQELKSKKKEIKKKDSESGDETNKVEKTEQNKGTDAESSVVETNNKENKEVQKEKRKKKIRLDMHGDQRFVDSLDAYVWIYDPIPLHYWICGALVVIGTIGICMFPLWPPIVRLGVYYISVAAACFLVSIIVMAVIRLILFCLIWVVTFGKHHLWILPNLTEDVGFFASFWPLYKYEYRGGSDAAAAAASSSLSDKKKKKKKKDKDSDAEEDDNNKENNAVEDVELLLKKGSSEEDEPMETENNQRNNDDDDEGSNNGSESESESKSSTGKDFEIVDQQEFEQDDHQSTIITNKAATQQSQ